MVIGSPEASSSNINADFIRVIPVMSSTCRITIINKKYEFFFSKDKNVRGRAQNMERHHHHSHDLGRILLDQKTKSDQTTITYTLATVQKGTVITTVTGTGQVSANNQVAVDAQSPEQSML